MGPDEHDPDRRLRRHRLRRLHSRRRRRERRLGAAAIGIVILALLAVLVASADDGGHDRVAPTVEARLKGLELNRDPETRHRQAEAVEDVLGYTEFVREGVPRKPQVALTFDDGPSPYTDEILRILRRHDAPATFFVVGERVDGLSQITRRAIRQGHEVAAHTYDHPHMGQLHPEAQAEELIGFDNVMRAHDLPIPRLFRPPYGSFDAETLRLLQRRDALMVLWSVDTGDYENPGWDVIAERALAAAEPGAVILLHDGGGDRAQTIVALPLILEGLKKRGLRPVTIPQLLVDNPPPRDQSLEQATAVVAPGEGLPAGQ